MRKHIGFISFGGWPWGGSEELWSRSALKLRSRGALVRASVQGLPLHKRLTHLLHSGIQVEPRIPPRGILYRLRRKFIRSNRPLIVDTVARWHDTTSLSLVVISNGACFPPQYEMDLLEYLVTSEIPFVTIAQANFEDLWPDDRSAALYRKLLPLRSAVISFPREIGTWPKGK